MTSSGNLNAYYFVNAQSGEYMEIPVTARNSVIGATQSAFNGTTNQWWTLTSEADGTEVFQNCANVLDLEVPGSSTANGVQVDQNGYFGTANQFWFMHPVGTSTPTSTPIVPTINWPTPAGIVYGTPLSSSQLDATASVQLATEFTYNASVLGTFTYSPVAGTVLSAGNNTLSVTFTPNDTTDYRTVTASVNLAVAQATPTINWPTPAAIVYGAPLSSTQLDATASVPGTFSYSPAAGTVLPVGNDSLSVTFTPTDSTDYTSVTTSTTISVQSPQSFTISNDYSGLYLDNNSSTSSGTPIVQNQYTGSLNQQWNLVPVPNSTLNAYYLINAQSGLYLAIPVYSPHAGTIGATQEAYDGTALQWWTVGPASPGLEVIQNCDNVMDLADPNSSTASDTQVVQTGYTGTANDLWILHPVGSSTLTTPTINWPTPAAITYGTALSSAQLDATANVPGTFSYSPAAGSILPAGNDTLSVTFTPNDTVDYKTTTASVTLVVAQVTQVTPTINWPTPAGIVYGTPLSTTQLDATANVPGIFSYSPAAGTVLYAGNNTLSVTFTPSDTTDYKIATASVILSVAQATPTINWPTPAAIVYGMALSSTQLDATANVPGTFVYSPAAGTVLPASSNMLLVTFTPSDSNDYKSVMTGTTSNVQANGQIASWSVSIMNGSTPYYAASNMSSSWFASNESWLESWLATCATPGSNYSMTVTTTVNSSVRSGASTMITLTTSTVSIANSVPSYEYFTQGTWTKPSYPEYYSLDIKDTESTFTVNYVHNIAGEYDFTIQTSLSQSTPASHFGSPTPLLEQLGSSDPYGLYFTDSLYESASQRAAPYYSASLPSSSGNLALYWDDGTTYIMGDICPVFTSSNAAPIPTFSIFRINTSNLPRPWIYYTSTSLCGGYWNANTSMHGSDWTYTWYAATTQPTS